MEKLQDILFPMLWDRDLTSKQRAYITAMADSGGSAFPIPATSLPEHGTQMQGTIAGMTLREYYAGQALLGLMSRIGMVDLDHPTVATKCFALADAMITQKYR